MPHLKSTFWRNSEFLRESTKVLNRFLLHPCRAASSHHGRGERDGVSGLARRSRLPRGQHGPFQPDLAERRPRRPPGSTGERPGQPVAAAVVRDPGSVRLVRVRRHERRRRGLGADLPDCARWENYIESDIESPNSKFRFSIKNAINPKII